ncbi:hypothetical protein [Pendulispora albinea]|uniref:Lipoprotein n=1 Tax=Pendulispora albinea TaxID=2741071 RepID=A0ABZ2LP37_9BACT
MMTSAFSASRRARWVPGIVLSLLLAPTACSSSSDGPNYDGMFAPPPAGPITANNVRGFWVAHIKRDAGDGVDADMDIRMRITDANLTIANRCRYTDGTSLTAGITVALRIDDAQTDLITSESAESAPAAANHTCRLAVQAGTLEYHLNGRELHFQGRDLPYPKFANANESPPFTKAAD